MKGKYKCEKCKYLIEADDYLNLPIEKCPKCPAEKKDFILQPLEADSPEEVDGKFYRKYFFVYAEEMINPQNKIYILAEDESAKKPVNKGKYSNFKVLKHYGPFIFSDINGDYGVIRYFESTDIFKKQPLKIAY